MWLQASLDLINVARSLLSGRGLKRDRRCGFHSIQGRPLTFERARIETRGPGSLPGHDGVARSLLSGRGLKLGMRWADAAAAGRPLTFERARIETSATSSSVVDAEGRPLTFERTRIETTHDHCPPHGVDVARSLLSGRGLKRSDDVLRWQLDDEGSVRAP